MQTAHSEAMKAGGCCHSQPRKRLMSPRVVLKARGMGRRDSTAGVGHEGSCHMKNEA